MKSPYYLVAGLGQTGYSVAGHLYKQGLPFAVFDTRRHVERLTDFSAAFPGVEVFLGDFPSSLYSQVTQIIASPGLPLDNPFLEQARRHHIPIVGDIECFATLVEAPVIAITGTNGKSTVTALVGEMAKAAGIEVAVGGNIGLPVLDLLNDAQTYDLWVLELSSFQLDLTYSLKPLASTILNITPDHLDRHHSFENYVKAKHRIYRQSQYCLYNNEDASTKPMEKANRIESFGLNEPTKDHPWGISLHQGDPFLTYGDHPFLSVHTLKLQGKHNWQNALAASALAFQANIPLKVIASVLETFSGLPHRCQTVRQLRGVTWINDSKGTNVGAAVSAIEGIGPTISGKIVLIAGGLGKGASFEELRPVVKQYVKEVVLIGQDAQLIAETLSDTTIPLTQAPSFEAAITQAHSVAQSGDVVLLSPACASQDMFKDYVHRGNCFSDLVNALA